MWSFGGLIEKILLLFVIFWGFFSVSLVVPGAEQLQH